MKKANVYIPFGSMPIIGNTSRGQLITAKYFYGLAQDCISNGVTAALY